MSLAPIGTQTTPKAQQITETQKATEAKDAAAEPAQPTSTPEDVQRATPDAATQDAAREVQGGRENQIRQQLEEGWMEARGRKRGGRGGRTTAMRGLGGGDTELA